MKHYVKKNVKKTYRKKSVVGKAVKKPSNSIFKKKVLSVIKAQTETKQAFYTSGNSLVNFNSGINTTADMLQILPNITQSITDNGRIGDQIRAQKLNIKGYIKLALNTTFNASTLPSVMARLFIVSLKSKANYTEATSSATPLSGLLKLGGTTTGFYGNLQQIMAVVNTDLWTVHVDKKYYLNQSFLYQPGGSAAIPVASDVKNTLKFFNFNIKCKNKLLKYDSNISSALLPVNFGPMLLLGYSYLDGTTPDILTTNLGLQYDVTFDYEDA